MGDSLLDLVELVPGPQRRFRESFVDDEDDEYFPDEDGYREWRLRLGAGQLLELLDRSPETGDVLLNFLLNDAVESQVVWLSPTNVVVCEGPETDDLTYRVEYHTKLFIYDSDSRRYRVFLDSFGGHETLDTQVLHLLHVVVALGTRVGKIVMSLYDGQDMYPGIIPGIREYVALARSRRTVEFHCLISAETGRELAHHCNPMVELEADLRSWEDHGASLAEAMLANQCPARLTLGYLRGDEVEMISPALAATRAVEELKICLPVVEDVFWDAIRRNRGVRVLAATQDYRIKYNDAKVFWSAGLANGTVERIDARLVFEGLLRNASQKRECSELIGTLIRSNPRITCIQYDPRTQDAQIMKSCVVPILHFNKFRPIVEALFNGSADGAGRERTVSALFASPLVRRHPELLYLLIKANREHVLASSDVGRLRPTVTRPRRKRGRR